jgi:Domain of unknown function (DUF4124)
MNKLTYLLISTLLLSTTSTYADSKIVKWVDGKGVTHYGDKPPSFEESKSNVEMNKQGMVTKKNAAIIPKDSALDLQQQQQARKDKILLDSYTNANEIDLARDRSLEMSKAALTSLASQKEGISARIARNNQTAEGFKKRNKALPANLDSEFKEAIAQSGRIDKQVVEHKLAMAQTRKTYAEDKARYLILKQPTTTAGASADTSATAAATPASSTVASPSVEKVFSDKK